MTITQALIMAAGHATRMRPLTDNLPKPLLEVNHKPLLTHIIDHLIAEKVSKIIINGYHAIEPLRDYMIDIQSRYPDVKFILSEEAELLETGGGAVLALQYLDTDKPFYMINGDAFWVNPCEGPSLQSLAKTWQDKSFDIVLLLQPTSSMGLTTAVGDYDIGQGNIASRNLDKNGGYMFTGVRICTPNVLKNYKVEKFSFLKMMDEAESKGKLGGAIHHGDWYHISEPDDLNDVNRDVFGVEKT